MIANMGGRTFSTGSAGINLLWTGELYNSSENCHFSATETGAEINSTIVGVFEKRDFTVEYFIKMNPNWETVSFEIKSLVGDKKDYLNFQRVGQGNWSTNGNSAPKFDGCMDIDISVTPFTNTLPINRLKIVENESYLVDVMYIDVLELQLKRVQQRYTRVSKVNYRYENVPNDFEAIITVDDLGFVVSYPGLFARTAR